MLSPYRLEITTTSTIGSNLKTEEINLILMKLTALV